MSDNSIHIKECRDEDEFHNEKFFLEKLKDEDWVCNLDSWCLDEDQGVYELYLERLPLVGSEFVRSLTPGDLKQIREILRQLEVRGIVHNDFKTKNMGKTAADGRVKIFDFGQATYVGVDTDKWNAELERLGIVEEE
eukprot:GFYU01023676.1.p1 GENE.GFYU01023676.1~~GFYU01023676.1.p1  ORF type:complete len:137 (+),score=37.15 GFYU01023676.1:241-651(+)